MLVRKAHNADWVPDTHLCPFEQTSIGTYVRVVCDVWTLQAKPRLRADGIKSIVDPLLMDDYPIDTLFDMADLALKCTSIEKEDRPTMRVCIDSSMLNVFFLD